MIDRIDFLLSYWIFFWYLLYELKIIKYNPKLALSIALISNIIPLTLMIYYKNNISYILLLLVINFFIKVIPLLRLKNKINYCEDMYIIGIIVIFYILWLSINDINIKNFNFIDDIKSNRPFSSMIAFMSK